MGLSSTVGFTDLEQSSRNEVKFPNFYCHPTTLLPFIVVVNYGQSASNLGGNGGRAYYLWFLGLTVCLSDENLWNS